MKRTNGNISSSGITYINLKIPNFIKSESEISTRLKQWLYFIWHLEDFQSIPTIFKDDIFTKAFEKAELAKFVKADLDAYEMNLKNYRDYKNTIDTAFDEGKLEGRLEGKLEGKLEREQEIAKSAKKMGLSVDAISKLTGLSTDEINKL
jgi:predicted transposase/invertase (TIGR01784 family)